jgi:heme/copper-type cytochrome/quinol oxidase subunit 1
MTGRMLDERTATLHCGLTFLTYNMTFFPMFILGVGGMMRRIYDPTQYAHLQPLQPLNIFVTQSAFALGIIQLIAAANVIFSLRERNAIVARAALAGVCFLGGLSLALPTGQALSMLLDEAGAVEGGTFRLPYPAVSLSLGVVAGLLAMIYGRGGSTPRNPQAPDNPWDANSLEWQISSPPPRSNFAEIPTVYRPPYDFSLPNTEPGTGLPQTAAAPSAKVVAS